MAVLRIPGARLIQFASAGDVPVPVRTRLGFAFERLAVPVHETEGGPVSGSPLVVVQQAPVQVTPYVDPVRDRCMDAGEGAAGIGDPAGVVAGGDAVLGDQDRDVSGDLVGAADPQFGGRWVELPAGQGALHRVTGRQRPIGADEVAGIGLDAHEVIAPGLFQVPEITRVAVLVQHFLTARFSGGLEGLGG